MRIILPLTLFLGCGALAAAAPTVPPGPPPAATSGRAVQAGIAVDFTAVDPAGKPGELREGQTALFRFKISDTATGTPVAGASPAGWVDFTPDAQVEAKSCGDRVGELISGSLLSRPEVDLNTYHVLALNEDATISVIDPLLGFGGTKLLAMVFLDAPGEDWVLAKDGNRLFVSVPNADQIAVVDTVAWKVVAKVAVGPRPGRLALQADGAALWTTLEDGAVAVIDTAHLTMAARIPTGAGRHEIVLADDGRLAYVTNRDARTLSVLDAARRVKLRDVPLGAAPTAIAWSPLARMAYVTSEEAGTVVVVGEGGEAEGGKPGVVARMTAEPGLGAIRFAPGGRLGFVVVPRSHRLLILDAARNRIVQTATLEHAPERVTFSDHLAYVRQRDSEVVLMVPLEQVGEEGKAVPVVDFPGGEHALGDVLLPSPADSIVRAPGGTAVLVANPGDKAIFYYKEGMAAPVGSFQNYSRQPRAVLVVDRSLRERAPGLYEAEARLPGPGRYQVAFFLDAPRTVHCFPLTVTVDPAEEEARARREPARIESLIDAGRELRAGETVRLRFRLSDPRTHAPKDGLQDVVMMVYQSSSNEQWREVAKPAGEGVYEMELTPPAAGIYHVAVECLSQNLPFHLSPPVILRVTEGKAAAAP